MSTLPSLPKPKQALTATQFRQLAAVPPEAEWFANLDNPRTRRAYQNDLHDFMGFAGIQRPEAFRIVPRAHVLAWRKTLEDRRLSGATIRRKLAALSSLYEYLCEKNAVDFNPVKGAKRPKIESNEGKTPALSNHQARALLDAPNLTDPADCVENEWRGTDRTGARRGTTPLKRDNRPAAPPR